MKKFLIKVNGSQYEVEVEEVNGSVTSPVQAPVSTTAKAAPAPVPAPAPAAAAAPAKAATPAPAGATIIVSPMPGTILRIETKVGESVTNGQVLLILEAMKMENEIVAPADGIVASINVESGASVNAGDVLVSLS